jgi:hypothetical protein
MIAGESSWQMSFVGAQPNHRAETNLTRLDANH